MLPTIFLSLTLTAGAEPAAPINDGLDEVNAKRAARGLQPFVRDYNLTLAAHGAANYRASYRMFGHVACGMGDFQFLPPGARADAAGCAAYPIQDGWLSCCTYDRAVYAGAAWVTGADGKRYMHLFISNTASAPVTAPPVVAVPMPMTAPPAAPPVVVQAAPCAPVAVSACESNQRVRLFQRDRLIVRERVVFRGRLFGGCR